jgi:thiol-disulfide isomerase/thioredoxin
MKILFTLVLLIFSLSSCAKQEETSPNWTLTDITGQTHNFPTSQKGKTTIILFWATWCPFCKRLMPHLQSVIYQYGEKLNLQVFALNINEDEDPEEYLNENGYDFLLFKEAEKVAEIYQIRGTPGLLVFDKNGNLQFDLRQVHSLEMSKMKLSPRWQKAIKLGPYWASELRKKLSTLN